MSHLVVGLSHHTAPLDLLERSLLDRGAAEKLLGDLVATGHVSEAAVIATCNRLEVVAEVERFHAGVDAVCDASRCTPASPLDELRSHLYVHYEERAVRHVFTVAAGLDSMVVGETQILGQVRTALRARAGRRNGGQVAARAPAPGDPRRQAGPGRDRAVSGRAGRWSISASRRPPAALDGLAGRDGAGGRSRDDELARRARAAPSRRRDRCSSPTAAPIGPRGWPPRSTAQVLPIARSGRRAAPRRRRGVLHRLDEPRLQHRRRRRRDGRPGRSPDRAGRPRAAARRRGRAPPSCPASR